MGVTNGDADGCVVCIDGKRLWPAKEGTDALTLGHWSAEHRREGDSGRSRTDLGSFRIDLGSFRIDPGVPRIDVG